ncbi:hypothetical protein SELMODRAFT_422977 [Selaginella moellendorffii]|uniref:Uncharacterized protein n=1 Tax=Selaginella moellendorffii TaxID=88036 RepID=D8SK61_SELML|nr:myosin-4 [Selaginella moellendorffii]XP_024544583.1 myosin-4 [Selaginella moellendorffii]XP_024544584.1 myosin-4 [Selaginella moellendorffii]EFJ15278.1 hypothetical protein SELMODRAFT_422977 [Selaginella moellendorffii]|eukprot:XP_002983782.1 myosin-4 [Selaginella moellendorffii]
MDGNRSVVGDRSSTPDKKVQPKLTDVESVLSQSLRNENDLLRCQLNDVIAREKNQRIELQRLRQHRDAEVSSLVQSQTSQLKCEVEQLKSLLQGTSAQLREVINERDELHIQKEEALRAFEEARHNAGSQESRMADHIRSLEEALCKSTAIVSSLADSVDSFQRHVLPTFKPSGFEVGKLPQKVAPDSGEGRLIMQQLTRLENSLTLLRVIVDAKNDTLVLIRGKLKQENEELRNEMQLTRDKKQPTGQAVPSGDEAGFEKHLLRQELQSLQKLFNAEVQQLKSKLKMYETEEQQGQGRLMEVQKELTALQDKLHSVEASRAMLEASLKEESSARSQLVSQVFQLRKDNEKARTELETLKLNQKFLVRQPRNGRIPPEKMDLMNTVNQLLMEINKLKSEKVGLEEELKTLRRTQVRDRVKRGVTARDVEMAALNKVGDGELASKLARSRLQQLAVQDNSRPFSPALTDCSSHGSVGAFSMNVDYSSSSVLQGGLQGANCCLEMPSRDEVYHHHPSGLTVKAV